MVLLLLYFVLAFLATGKVVTVPLWHLTIKNVSIPLDDLALSLLLVAYFFRCLSKNRVPNAAGRRFVIIYLFIVWATLSLLINIAYFDLTPVEGLFSASYLLRWTAYATVYGIASEYAANRANAHRMVQTIVGTAVAFATFGIFQAIYLPNFALLVHPDARAYIDYDVQGHRLVSTFLDPNIAAPFIAISALMAIAFYLQGYKRWITPAILLSTAVLFTLSRGGVFGFVMGALFLLYRTKFMKRRFAVVALLAGGVLLTSIPWLAPIALKRHRLSIEDASAQSRVQDWKFGGTIIADNPVIGVGFNTFGFIVSHYGATRYGNSAFGLAGDFLLIPVLTGLPGLAIYLYLIGRLMRNGRDALKDSDPWRRAIGSGIRSATLTAVISSLFTSVLLFPEITAVLWVLWAVLEQSCSVGEVRPNRWLESSLSSHRPKVEAATIVR